jgi:hypothetical protein
MITPFSRHFALLAVAVALGSPTAKATDVAPPPLPLPEVLQLKGGKAVVFQPFVIKPGQTLRATYAQFGPDKAIPGPHRGLRLVIYRSTLTDGTYQVIGDSGVVPLDRSKEPVTTLEYTHPIEGGQPNGIIAVLIGLLLPAVQTADQAPTPAPLPPHDSVSVEVSDTNALIGLLLPAVQKVREAAAR